VASSRTRHEEKGGDLRRLFSGDFSFLTGKKVLHLLLQLRQLVLLHFAVLQKCGAIRILIVREKHAPVSNYRPFREDVKYFFVAICNALE